MSWGRGVMTRSRHGFYAVGLRSFLSNFLSHAAFSKPAKASDVASRALRSSASSQPISASVETE